MMTHLVGPAISPQKLREAGSFGGRKVPAAVLADHAEASGYEFKIEFEPKCPGMGSGPDAAAAFKAALACCLPIIDLARTLLSRFIAFLIFWPAANAPISGCAPKIELT